MNFAYVLKYNHNHGKGGRFASDPDGPGALLYASTKPEPEPKEEDIINAGLTSQADRDEYAAAAARSGGIWKNRDTLGSKANNVKAGTYTKEGGGRYTEARKELHRQIIAKVLENSANCRPSPGEKPTAIFLGGRGGSGKSNLDSTENAEVGVYDRHKFIVLDADHIKTLIPGYDPEEATRFHEESSDILNKAMRQARAQGLNTVIDFTMNPNKMGWVKQYEKAGYDLEGYFIHRPAHLAAASAVSRWKNPQAITTLNGTVKRFARGRLVPPHIVLANTKNEANFDKLTPHFKKWALYKNADAKTFNFEKVASGGSAAKRSLFAVLKGNPNHDPKSGEFSSGSGGSGDKDVSGWKKVGAQAGSNPGGVYADEGGGKHYVKFAQGSPGQMRGEHLADSIYRTLDIPAKRSEIVTRDGKTGLSSDMLSGAKNLSEDEVNASNDVKSGRVADAYLANWDVFGMTYDNITKGSGGKDHRIDNGGAMFYRAQGAPKDFPHDNVPELKSMVAFGKKGHAAYGDLPKEEVQRQAQVIVNRMTPDKINSLVDAAGIKGSDKDRYVKALNGRREVLRKTFLSQEPPAIKCNYAKVLKFNANHGEHGRFASAGKGMVSLPDSLGVARKDMPQVASVDLPDFRAYLSGKGVTTTDEVAQASDLKPIQKHVSAEKAAKLAGSTDLPGKPIVVSRDSYILDGHHRWFQAKQEGGSLHIVRTSASMKELLDVSKSYPKVFFEGAQADRSTKIDYVSVLKYNHEHGPDGKFASTGWYQSKSGNSHLFVDDKGMIAGGNNKTQGVPANPVHLGVGPFKTKEEAIAGKHSQASIDEADSKGLTGEGNASSNPVKPVEAATPAAIPAPPTAATPNANGDIPLMSEQEGFVKAKPTPAQVLAGPYVGLPTKIDTPGHGKGKHLVYNPETGKYNTNAGKEVNFSAASIKANLAAGKFSDLSPVVAPPAPTPKAPEPVEAPAHVPTASPVPAHLMGPDELDEANAEFEAGEKDYAAAHPGEVQPVAAAPVLSAAKTKAKEKHDAAMLEKAKPVYAEKYKKYLTEAMDAKLTGKMATANNKMAVLAKAEAPLVKYGMKPEDMEVFKKGLADDFTAYKQGEQDKVMAKYVESKKLLMGTGTTYAYYGSPAHNAKMAGNALAMEHPGLHPQKGRYEQIATGIVNLEKFNSLQSVAKDPTPENLDAAKKLGATDAEIANANALGNYTSSLPIASPSTKEEAFSNLKAAGVGLYLAKGSSSSYYQSAEEKAAASKAHDIYLAAKDTFISKGGSGVEAAAHNADWKDEAQKIAYAQTHQKEIAQQKATDDIKSSSYAVEYNTFHKGPEHPDTLAAAEGLVKAKQEGLNQGLSAASYYSGIKSAETAGKNQFAEEQATQKELSQTKLKNSLSDYYTKKEFLGKDHPDTMAALDHVDHTMTAEKKYYTVDEFNGFKATAQQEGVDAKKAQEYLKNMGPVITATAANYDKNAGSFKYPINPDAYGSPHGEASSEAAKSFKSVQDPQIATLTSGEREVLESYTSSGYKAINKAVGGAAIGTETLSESMRGKMEKMDSAFAKVKLGQNIKLVRTMPDKYMWSGLGINKPDTPGAIKALVGKVYTEHAYSSTTMNPEGIGVFSESANQGKIELKIRASAETHGIRVQGDISSHSSEQEVVLPRGTTYVIRKATKGFGNNWTLDVDVLGAFPKKI